MPPLSVAALGWVLVVLGVEPNGGSWDVSVDAAGWGLAAFGWHRLVRVERAYAPARAAALAGAVVALLRLGDGPELLLTVVYLASLMLVMLGLALGASALLSRAREGGSALVSGQASFLRWAGLGLLLVECVGALALPLAPSLGGLVISAAQMGLVLAVWFAVLQLFSSRRDWAKPVAVR